MYLPQHARKLVAAALSSALALTSLSLPTNIALAEDEIVEMVPMSNEETGDSEATANNDGGEGGFEDGGDGTNTNSEDSAPESNNVLVPEAEAEPEADLSAQAQSDGTVSVSNFAEFSEALANKNVTKIILTDTITISSSASLNLSGVDVVVEDSSIGDAIKVTGGTVSITGGRIYSTSGVADAAVIRVTGGDLTLGRNLKVYANSRSIHGVAVENSAKLTLDGGYISILGASYSPVFAGSSATVTVNSGTLIPDLEGKNLSVSGSAKVTILGGTFWYERGSFEKYVGSDRKVVAHGTGDNAYFTVESGTAPENDLSRATVTLTPDSYVYDATEKKPTVVVKIGDALVSPSAYTVSYSNNTKAGVATVTIVGKASGGSDGITAKSASAASEDKGLSASADAINAVTGTTSKTFTIAKKAATVSANASNKTAGQGDPTLTAVATGLATGHKLESYSISRAAGENAGTYAITPSAAKIVDASGEDVTPNYSITYNTATFTITGAAQQTTTVVTSTTTSKSATATTSDSSLNALVFVGIGVVVIGAGLILMMRKR